MLPWRGRTRIRTIGFRAAMATEPTETERLLAEEAARERRERHLAEQATEPAEERAAERRADKAAYLTEKLREREASEES
jgi:hypothetical protein